MDQSNHLRMMICTASGGGGFIPLDIPNTPALTDAQRASARKKLAAAISKLRIKKVCGSLR